MKPASLFFFLSLFYFGWVYCQQPDISKLKVDSANPAAINKVVEIEPKFDSTLRRDTLVSKLHLYNLDFQQLFRANRFLNAYGTPIAIVFQPKKHISQESYFYLLAIIAILFGLFRFFYTRYFNNLFRVFFNASLRQSQLTDQLLQAKLPSLFFNSLFILTSGIYVYLLLRYYQWITFEKFWPIFFYCTASVGIIYLTKFLILKFTGWLTNYREVTNTYLFIIFLINKILGILLLPFAILIAFSVPTLANVSAIISLLFIGLMFLLRFFKAYGLLQRQIKVSKFHFFLYVAGIEIIPVLLIYKGLVLLLSKNL